MGIDLPPLNSNKIEKLTEALISKLNDDEQCLKLFEKAVTVFNKSGLDISQKQFKTESETDLLIKTLKEFAQ